MFTEQWDAIPFEHTYPIHEIPLMKGGCWAWKTLLNLLFNQKERRFERQVRRRTEDKAYDIILCTTFSTFPLTTATRIAHKRHLPLLIDLRDLDEQVPGAQYQYHRQWFLRPFRHLYQTVQIRRRNHAIRQAQAITTISPWHTDFIRHLTPSPVHLIYNGFDPEQFYPEDIHQDTFRITYIGRLYGFQDLHPLQQALNELSLPDAELCLHLPDNNYLPIDQVGNAIRHSSVMIVLTNRQAKGMMTTKFFEALGCEKPVLCIPSDNGLLHQTIRETNAGIATDNIQEIKAFLLEKYAEWKHNGFTRQAVNLPAKQPFSRTYQARQFEQICLENAIQSKTVSIIVPIYNVERYLPQCLQSVQQQTYPRLQVIMVDDGSMDSSADIARQTALHDPRFVLVQQANQGLSAARNTGLQHATGDYLMFVDADDWLERDCVETLLSQIGDCDTIGYGYRRVTDEGKVIKTASPLHPYQLTSACLRCYRRSWLEQQHLRFEKGVIYEDVLFSIALWACRPKQKNIRYIGYNYRQNPFSITAQPHREARMHLYQRLRQQRDWRMRLIAFYTWLRLKIHFLYHG